MSKETWKADIFENLFQQNPDPWNFENSSYEHKKLQRVLQCLPCSPVAFAVELGCAIGVGTLALSQRCQRILAVDASETALTKARQRCQKYTHITFLRAFLPSAYPVIAAAGCDLILISEILYFLSRTDIQKLAFDTTTSLKTTGHILIVNWTGETDTPCTGDEAANCFIQACRANGWMIDLSERAEGYRIDRLILSRTHDDEGVPSF
ncbi:class I SAM-dependent DNA methyltransferase [Gluconobacter cerinus]|uniref:class I SAM-dependent DNA methyltransferase n=1 Tax=Gluconobacter cerinus TaxID=38307 RepID=UPI001B8BC971|nr:methyltransferase domain-containing protein [Gluconobacter cerinus]